MSIKYLAVLLSGLLLSTGCSQSSSVAIIDLDEVAKQTGAGESIQEQARVFREQHENELNRTIQLVRKQYQEAREQLLQTPDKSADLDALTDRVSAQLDNARQAAEKEVQDQRKNLVRNYYDSIKPKIQLAAEEVGADVVLTMGSNVIWHDEAQDITATVIDKLNIKQAD